ncbi:MAG: NADH-ubiquinone oxidoreductase subunit 6 [Methylibium sp. NZG]|nr:MAG: NADH-ubiquinone oxidoreductase subunit 6 [Methylibium sp. NZG]
MSQRRRVAVVGSGISGLAVAHGLAGDAQVTLFEAGTYFGGHTNTVDVHLDGVTHGVDTGFLVLNGRTYPELLKLFAQLGVDIAKSDMSFSVQVPDQRLEWSGSDLGTVFAQRRNLLRPAFWRMLADVLRFNRLATALAVQSAAGTTGSAPGATALDQPIGEFLDQHRFSTEFRDWYFLPMIGCIWSCPTDQMLRFPVATMIRFCHNHGLIQVANRPQWYTVRGGARQYVQKMLRAIPDARLNAAVRSVRRVPAGAGAVGRAASVEVSTDAGTERFDDVVLACHSDQSLALLADPTAQERATLGAVRYHRNRAVLHTDTSMLPQRRLAWAAWNYERAAAGSREQAAVCLHYLINRLQPLPFKTPVLVSLNPLTEPRADTVHAEFDYAHPVFDAAAIAAQRQVPALQGRARTWFCGAWTRYGFHEDGLVSGLAVVEALKARWAGEGGAARVEPAEPVPVVEAA